jgi:hypothetical protein
MVSMTIGEMELAIASVVAAVTASTSVGAGLVFAFMVGVSVPKSVTVAPDKVIEWILVTVFVIAVGVPLMVVESVIVTNSLTV